MIARATFLTLAAVLSFESAALAQSTKTPQNPPNPGSAEAQPSTVQGPGGYTTEPSPQPQSAPAQYGGDANSGNDFTASPKLGPQQDLGRRINRTVHYLAADIIAPPVVYDAFSPGTRGLNYRSYAARAAFEVPVGQYDVYVGADARKWTYPTHAGAVTGLAPQGVGILPSFAATDYDSDVRAGLKVTGPRVYATVSYLLRGTNTGEPRERGIGYGIEKLADVDQHFSLHGSVLYYPNVGGSYAFNGSGSYGVSYRVLRYLVGASIQPPHVPLFVDVGFLGDRSKVRTDAPVGFNHQGPYAGVGIRF
jgi:hypothetical protein